MLVYKLLQLQKEISTDEAEITLINKMNIIMNTT